jgi:hypothetical protein
VLTQEGKLVLVDLASLQQTPTPLSGPVSAYGTSTDIIPLDPGPDRHFIIKLNTSPDWYYLSTNVALMDSGLSADLVSVAPDQKHWLTIKDDLRLFTNGSNGILTYTLPPGMQAGDFQNVI